MEISTEIAEEKIVIDEEREIELRKREERWKLKSERSLKKK